MAEGRLGARGDGAGAGGVGLTEPRGYRACALGAFAQWFVGREGGEFVHRQRWWPRGGFKSEFRTLGYFGTNIC